MDIWEAMVLGIVQGLTEWLPVSSSGHLAMAQHWMSDVPVSFDIMLHFGTLIVLVFYFRKDIARNLGSAKGVFDDAARLGGGFGGLRSAIMSSQGRKTTWFVLFGFIPTACIGVVFQVYLVDQMYTDLRLVGILLVITGALLITTRGANGKKRMRAVDTRHAYLIGLAQGFSTAPGLSRSGTTVSTALLLGMERETAGRTAFLMGVPALLGAAVYHLMFNFDEITGSDLQAYIIGTIMAMAVGYLTLSWLMKLIRSGGFWAFAPYCLVLGTAALYIGFVGW